MKKQIVKQVKLSAKDQVFSPSYYNYTEPKQRSFKPNETQHVVLRFENLAPGALVGASLLGNSGVGTAEVISSLTVPVAVPGVPNVWDIWLYWHNTMSDPWSINVDVAMILFYMQG